MRIGIVGSGRIGGLLGKLWASAGHEVLFSSRNPKALFGLVASSGSRATAGTPEQAIAFGEVVLLSIPFHFLPELGRRFDPALAGRIVLDTSNPYPDRDGPMAEQVRASGRGTGPFLRE